MSELLPQPGRAVRILANDDVTEGSHVWDLIDRAIAAGVRVELVPKKLMALISDVGAPQPILAIGEIPSVGWADVRSGLIVILDGVQDPGNAGTLTRTAAALGASAVVLVGAAADPWGPKAMRAAAGSTFKLPVFRSSRTEAVSRLADRKIPVWVAHARGDPVVHGDERPENLALVLGSEAHGVSEAMRAVASRTVGVKLHAQIESLNVAAAGAILLDRLGAD